MRLRDDTVSWLLGLLAFLVGVILVMLALSDIARADHGDSSPFCPDLDTGFIHSSPIDPVYEEIVTAPDGLLIDAYCVKAGNVHRGEGPVLIVVDPPQKTVSIVYPRPDPLYPAPLPISYYTLSFIEEDSSSTVPEITTTTVPPTTTTFEEETTTTPALSSTTTTSGQVPTTSTDPTTSTLPSTSTSIGVSGPPTLPFTGSEGAGSLVGLALMLMLSGGLALLGAIRQPPETGDLDQSS